MWWPRHSDWCVIAHEQVGERHPHIISVQFKPVSPKRSEPKPALRPVARELEVA
jgi:hypothetical protein